MHKRTKLNVQDVMELTEFIATTISFRNTIYKQKFGTAMGSPVSPILANLFMEWLETTAITTAPETTKPRLWKRYVDDLLEIVKGDQVDNLTNHLNQENQTRSIKFMHKTEKEGVIPFLDTKIVRRADKTVKLQIYRKPSHTCLSRTILFFTS